MGNARVGMPHPLGYIGQVLAKGEPKRAARLP
jgi:hypothetical protein